MKTCRKCTRELEIGQFYNNKATSDGKSVYCKDCTYTRILPQKHQAMLERGSKPCRRCERDLPFSEFAPAGTGPLKLAILCRECYRAREDEKLSPEDRNRVKEWRWRQDKQRKGLCISCGQNSADGTKRRCLSCSIARSTGRAEKVRAWVKAGLCTGCGRFRDRTGTQCIACWDRDRAKKSRKKLRDKLLFIEMYGGKCSCCGEDNPSFLTTDHVNRDGHLERKAGGRKAITHRSLTKSKRDDIRVLCFNCNCGRELHNGICPHEMAQSF